MYLLLILFSLTGLNINKVFAGVFSDLSTSVSKKYAGQRGKMANRDEEQKHSKEESTCKAFGSLIGENGTKKGIEIIGGSYVGQSIGIMMTRLSKFLPTLSSEVVGSIGRYMVDGEADNVSLTAYLGTHKFNMLRGAVLSIGGSMIPLSGGTIIIPIAGEAAYHGLKRNEEYWNKCLGDNASNELESAMILYWEHNVRPKPYHYSSAKLKKHYESVPKKGESFVNWLGRTKIYSLEQRNKLLVETIMATHSFEQKRILQQQTDEETHRNGEASPLESLDTLFISVD